MGCKCVKLLFDENLSPRLTSLLKDLFPGSLHVHDIRLGSSNDQEVWRYAAKEDYLIVTKDADFYDYSQLLGIPPKVIWIRRGNCSTRQIETMLRQHHTQIIALEAEKIGVLVIT